MAFHDKKLSINLPNSNWKKLERIKEETRTPYGCTINTLIDTFCDLPDAISQDIIDTCKVKVRYLLKQKDKAGGFEADDISSKIKKYLSIMTFLNHGQAISIDQFKPEPVMKTISIKNGSVIYPADWIVVNADQADQCEYAGVVECRNAARYGIPHFLFFSNKKYAKDYTQQELACINRLCACASQPFADAVKKQVSLIEDPEHPGEYLNVEEHFDAPYIGHFHLYEQGDPTYPSDYNPPYGARIVRNPEK